MANSEFSTSVNKQPPMFGVTNDANFTPTAARFDPVTKRLLVDVGTISVTATPASNGATASAVPAQADYIGGNKAGNLVGLLIGQQLMASSLAVVIASDQASIPVAATLSAETTKVIGTINIAAGQTIGITANSSVNVAQMNGVAVTMGNGIAGTGVQRVAIASDNTVLPGVGAGATGSAVPANASYDGLLAQTALPSVSTAGNLVGALSDKFGRQVGVLGTVRDLRKTQTTTLSATTTETTIITAGAAGVFNDIVMLLFSNTSATAVRVDIRDATAGTIIGSIEVPANAPAGFAVPGSTIPQTTAANNWTAQCAASVTDLRVLAIYEQNK